MEEYFVTEGTTINRVGLKISYLLVVVPSLWACGQPSSSESSFNFSYALERIYTGASTNVLTFDLTDPGNDSYTYSISSLTAGTSVVQDAELPLQSGAITFTYQTEGIHSADFKVSRGNGTPYIFEILAWEYSVELPEAPIVSFRTTATKSLTPNLIVSDGRSDSTTEIFVAGDISTTGKAKVEDSGFWEELPLTSLSLPVTLTPGDGLKTVNAKFKNIFGNVSTAGVPAQILLKQTPPANCEATPISATINTNKLAIRMEAVDPYQTYYSAFGDVYAIVNQNPFANNETVNIFLEPTVGTKTINVSIGDIAGNNCLQKDITVTIDPNFQSEGIWLQGATYTSETENVVIDVFFDHFADQNPLQMKVTGDVSGPNTQAWIPYQQNLPVVLTPTTSGSKRLYAQYKDKNGVESYLITRRIFLKPTITLQDAGAPFKNVIVSNILDAVSLTITGCSTAYNAVAYQAAYLCQPNAATVDVTYLFDDTSTLTKSVAP